MVANGDSETPKSTVDLKFEVGDIEFHEIFFSNGEIVQPHNWNNVPSEEPHSPGLAPRYPQLSLFLYATENS